MTSAFLEEVLGLPLLFGHEHTWAGSGLVAGADWEEIDSPGRQLRRLWADFARGTPLEEKGRIPGALGYRRAQNLPWPTVNRRAGLGMDGEVPGAAPAVPHDRAGLEPAR